MLTTQRPHPHSDRPSAIWFHLGALLTVTAWGISFVSTKILLDNGLRPAEIYVYRFVLAYLIVFCACYKKIWSNSWRDELLFMTCGLCAGSIYFIAENTALEYTLVSNVSLITSVSPLLTAIMVGAIYKSERPSKGTLIGSLVAFIGVACVIFNSSFVIRMNPLGDMLSLLAAFSWAIYSLVLRRLNALYTVMFITRKTFFYGVITAIPFMLLEPTDTTPSVLLRTEVWSNLLFLGVFASMLAYLIWAQAIKHLGAIKASNYLYVQPIITLVASVLLIGEHITIVGYVGCTLILLGVWLGDKLTQISSNRR